MTFEPALNAYGYPLLYLGTILEGETFVIISAILCQTGHLKVVWVVCAAFFGALSGDLFCFQMGRIGGGKLLKKESRWQRRADKASRLLKQHQTLVVFSYRFLYGLISDRCDGLQFPALHFAQQRRCADMVHHGYGSRPCLR
jgi:membrane protein DedA with SNARE-associated domain